MPVQFRLGPQNYLAAVVEQADTQDLKFCGSNPVRVRFSPAARFMLDENKRENIILTADDFGKSEKANWSILRLANLGRLNRVSVMADGNFAQSEIEALKNAGVKLDIHLELDWQKKRREKTKDNALKQGLIFLANHFRAGWRKKIWPRWEKQIEKFRELFSRYPDGINSHEYVHFFPPYFRIVLALANNYKIPYVRFGKTGLVGKPNTKKTVLGNLIRLNRKKFLASKKQSSDYFASLDWIENIENFLKNYPGGKIEIACHPEREEESELIEKYF